MEHILTIPYNPHPVMSLDFDDLYKGLSKHVADGNIYKQDNGNGLELFNYTPACMYEKSWDIYTILARGLVLDIVNKKVVCVPLPKFFNFGEISYELPNLSFNITEKVDGCCDENSILVTDKGAKTIKEICDMKYKGKVLSFNLISQQIEMDDIIGHSILPNTEEWYEIELEDGTFLTLTGNHEIYLPELNCYRRVDQLSGNEKFLQKK